MGAHFHTHSPLSPPRSSRAVSRQRREKERPSPAEPGALVPVHTLHTRMQASPGMLTLSYSPESNAQPGTGLLTQSQHPKDPPLCRHHRHPMEQEAKRLCGAQALALLPPHESLLPESCFMPQASWRATHSISTLLPNSSCTLIAPPSRSPCGKDAPSCCSETEVTMYRIHFRWESSLCHY